MELTGKQKAYIKKILHDKSPVIYIGSAGVTESIVSNIFLELNLKEAIKVKFTDFKQQKKELLAKVCEETGATLVDIIGHIGILYKENNELEKGKIQLP